MNKNKIKNNAHGVTLALKLADSGSANLGIQAEPPLTEPDPANSK
jgi:hypothetical protein